MPVNTTTRKLIDFTRARIREDLEVAGNAAPHFEVEATAHMTSQAHSAFVRRFDPGWLAGECARKLTLIDLEERQDAKLVEVGIDLTFGFLGTRVLASEWLDHPDFDPVWIGE